MPTPTGAPRSCAFLSVTSREALATYLDMTCEELAKLAWGMPDSLKYVEFEIPKRQGGSRRIQAPCRRLKAIQGKLKAALDEAYRPTAAAHGYVHRRSIITNANQHLGKSIILNLDLEDYFGTINFGRVRGLFMSRPFMFGSDVATVLAQLCCFQQRLPQGAPTSPVLANMVSYRLDHQLQRLAGDSHATYTRYADDITFSFSRTALPQDIVSLDGSGLRLGERLLEAIASNGFVINESKVRLSDKRHSRMSVTGITVNETRNVPRRYVRQVRSMLYAWGQHGLDAAQDRFNGDWDTRHRASGNPKAFADVVRGKLLYLRDVRGVRDDIYCRAATQFNALAHRDGLGNLELRVVPPSATERTAHEALWVVESETSIGTGFSVREGLVVTCAHCVRDDDGKVFDEVTIFKCRDHKTRWRARVVLTDPLRDLALCLPIGFDMGSTTCIDFSDVVVEHGTVAVLLGFPAYFEGSLESRIVASISNPLLVTGNRMGRFVQRFEIDKTIHHGASGSPVVDTEGRLLGVAAEGAVMVLNAESLGGRNTVVKNTEVRLFLDSARRRVHSLDAVTGTPEPAGDSCVALETE